MLNWFWSGIWRNAIILKTAKPFLSLASGTAGKERLIELLHTCSLAWIASFLSRQKDGSWTVFSAIDTKIIGIFPKVAAEILFIQCSIFLLFLGVKDIKLKIVKITFTGCWVFLETPGKLNIKVKFSFLFLQAVLLVIREIWWQPVIFCNSCYHTYREQCKVRMQWHALN